MKRFLIIIIATFIATVGTSLQAQGVDQIKKQIIEDSLATYSGRCPCPYNTDRAGRRCDGRSAYSRLGGASPLCYPDDVTDAMIAAWRVRDDGSLRKGVIDTP